MINEEYITPSLMLTVSTYELVNNKWIATMTHIFYANTQEELFKIMDAHKTTDSFFRASFEGIFKWKGEIIVLQNSEPFISYP